MNNKRPNIVFILTDDQRHDTIHALGNETIHTPNMDRLVERGTAFTQAHIPCGTSGAICMPSRAMVHSGRTLFHLEGAGQGIPRDHTTLGEAFRAAGYRTFGSGKWHNGRESYQRSFTDGDEIFFGGMADHWNVPFYHYDPLGEYDAGLPEVPEPHHSNAVRIRGCDHIHAGRHSTELISEAGTRFLDAYDGQEPFFLYLSYLAPHDPRTMPQTYRDLYDPASIDLPPNFRPGHPFDNGALHIRDEELAGFPRSPGETRRHIAEYYAMISHLDDQIGRVIAALESRDLLEETILVLAGDNGLAVGQHGLFGKQSCYDHSVRVPLVFAGPGVPGGVKSETLAYLFDIFPTLCELAGVKQPKTVEGQSLVEAMHDPRKRVREALYFAYTGHQRAIRRGDHKLIEYVVDGRHARTQLFNLREDPWETRNLAGEGGGGDRVEKLRDALRQLRDEWDDCRTVWGRSFWPAFERR